MRGMRQKQKISEFLALHEVILSKKAVTSGFCSTQCDSVHNTQKVLYIVVMVGHAEWSQAASSVPKKKYIYFAKPFL